MELSITLNAVQIIGSMWLLFVAMWLFYGLGYLTRDIEEAQILFAPIILSTLCIIATVILVFTPS